MDEGVHHRLPQSLQRILPYLLTLKPLQGGFFHLDVEPHLEHLAKARHRAVQMVPQGAREIVAVQNLRAPKEADADLGLREEALGPFSKEQDARVLQPLAFQEIEVPQALFGMGGVEIGKSGPGQEGKPPQGLRVNLL